VKVLELAQQLKVLRFGQITVAVDGTKVLANASKHSAVSYERAGQMIAQLELEVEQLIVKAEQADSTPLQDGLTIRRKSPGVRNAKRRWPKRVARSKPARRRVTPLSWPSTKRNWPGAPPGKNAARKWAANHRKPRRPNRGRETNITSPIPKAG